MLRTEPLIADTTITNWLIDSAHHAPRPLAVLTEIPLSGYVVRHILIGKTDLTSV